MYSLGSLCTIDRGPPNTEVNSVSRELSPRTKTPMYILTIQKILYAVYVCPMNLAATQMRLSNCVPP